MKTATAREQLLKDLGYVIRPILIGKTKKDDWQCYQWIVKVESKSGKFITIDYYTGLGLMTNGLGGKQPKKPKLADVLRDGLDFATDPSQRDYWFSDYGYNPDSIKDNKLFDQCCEITKKIKDFLGSDYQAILEAEHE